MKIYLKEKDGNFKLYEADCLSEEFKLRNISIPPGARVGNHAFIGNLATIGDLATIGNHAFIGDHAFIGNLATIGDHATIGNHAFIGNLATIGDRARVRPGAKIETTSDCIVLGPLGSRESILTAYKHEGGIMIGTGCFVGTIEKFEEQVKQVHGENRHGIEYGKVIRYVRDKFSA